MLFQIHYVPGYCVWQSIAIFVISYFHLAVEYLVYKASGGIPAFIFTNGVIFVIIFGSIQFLMLRSLTLITDADNLNLIRKRISNHQLV